jgi:phytoene synthase
LYAFCREVDDAVDDASDPAVAAAQLDWWRAEIERLYTGQPQHPVSLALAESLQRFDLPREYFDEILDGMQMDLQHSGFANFSELNLYCYRVAGAVGLLTIEIFGYRDRAVRKYARDLGTALQLTNILRDAGEDARRGRVYFAEDDMARFGVSRADLLQPRGSERTRALFTHYAQLAREHYRRAEQHLPESERLGQIAGLAMANIYRTLLDEIESDGLRVLEQRVSLTPLRKLWIAWRTLRCEKSRAKRHAKVAT